jgi:uncharacterized protein
MLLVRRYVPAFLVLALAPLPLVARAQAADSAQVIVVSAHAQITLPADHVSIRIAVDTRGETAVSAGTENARVHAGVLAALRTAGIATSDITSAGYTVSPQQSRENIERGLGPSGYLAQNAVHVRLTQLDRLGAVIDAALSAGANRIDGMRFGATQVDSARRVALATAITNARRDATAMAAAAGGSLGRLLTLSTEPFGSDVPGLRAAGMMGRALSTEITPREIAVTAVVYTRWALHFPSR